MASHRGNLDRDTKQCNLFLQCMDNSVASISVFALVDVRRIARQQLKLNASNGENHNEKGLSVEDCHNILKLPLTNLQFLQFWDKYASVLEQSMLAALIVLGSIGRSNTPVSFIRSNDFVKAVVKPYSAVLEANEEYNSWQSSLQHQTIHYVGDENENSECVYMIATDDVQKRICIVFRGSITPKDWVQDLQLVLSPIPNPLLKQPSNNCSDEELPETIDIHLGFRDYLYRNDMNASEKSSSEPRMQTPILKLPNMPQLPNPLIMLLPSMGRSAPNVVRVDIEDPSTDNPTDAVLDKPQLSKLETIREQLHALKRKYPEYNIYTSGHSLGAALALIVAMEAAADPILSMPGRVDSKEAPVTCITIGNPRVGGKEFGDTIERLEKTGKLHCLCIHNHLDVVPMMQSNPLKLISQDRGFRHVGFRSLLYGKGGFDLGRANHSIPLIRHTNGLNKSDADGHDSNSQGLIKPVWNMLFGKKDSPDDESEGETLDIDSGWLDPAADVVAEPIQHGKDNSNMPGDGTHSLLTQILPQRINLHDYRLYLDRLLELQPAFDVLTMDDLYERQRTKSS